MDEKEITIGSFEELRDMVCGDAGIPQEQWAYYHLSYATSWRAVSLLDPFPAEWSLYGSSSTGFASDSCTGETLSELTEKAKKLYTACLNSKEYDEAIKAHEEEIKAIMKKKLEGELL